MPNQTKVVSFYSFKGGTGRTTSLANTSYAMAEMGVDVGCIDLDLAAPGLHMIFPEIARAHSNTRTIHDYILKDQERGSRSNINIDKYTIDVGRKIGKRREYDKTEGDLFLLPGKVKEPVDGNPSTMVDKTIEIIEMFIESHDLDYLLLDARSGLSTNMVPLVQKSSQLFCFHRWTAQHKTGTKQLAEWLKDRTTPEDLVSVASNVPDEVDDSEVGNWAKSTLYPRKFNNYHIVNRSDILKKGEEVITLTKPERKTSEQYRDLAKKVTQN